MAHASPLKAGDLIRARGDMEAESVSLQAPTAQTAGRDVEKYVCVNASLKMQIIGRFTWCRLYSAP